MNTMNTEAQPRTLDVVRSLPCCTEVVDAARIRGISEVVHFTTLPGVIGIFAAQAVKARSLLKQDQLLEHILKLNAPNRSRDAGWHDYVNLSVSRINDWMFDRSQRWHAGAGVSWVLLSFTPDILGHPGVVFATTNNAYNESVLRSEGVHGFERLFDARVLGYSRRVHVRGTSHPSHWTTDRQAEVLYPFALPLHSLQRIYVQLEAAMDDVEGALGPFDADVEVILRPEVFA